MCGVRMWNREVSWKGQQTVAAHPQFLLHTSPSLSPTQSPSDIWHHEPINSLFGLRLFHWVSVTCDQRSWTIIYNFLEGILLQLCLKSALFTIARVWKQPKWPSTDEWIKKVWYVYTMEYYSAIKRSEIGSSAEIWMDLESVIQSEVSQKERNKYCILTHIICFLHRKMVQVNPFARQE